MPPVISGSSQPHWLAWQLQPDAGLRADRSHRTGQFSLQCSIAALSHFQRLKQHVHPRPQPPSHPRTLTSAPAGLCPAACPAPD